MQDLCFPFKGQEPAPTPASKRSCQLQKLSYNWLKITPLLSRSGAASFPTQKLFMSFMKRAKTICMNLPNLFNALPAFLRGRAAEFWKCSAICFRLSQHKEKLNFQDVSSLLFVMIAISAEKADQECMMELPQLGMFRSEILIESHRAKANMKNQELGLCSRIHHLGLCQSRHFYLGIAFIYNSWGKKLYKQRQGNLPPVEISQLLASILYSNLTASPNFIWV